MTWGDYVSYKARADAAEREVERLLDGLRQIEREATMDHAFHAPEKCRRVLRLVRSLLVPQTDRQEPPPPRDSGKRSSGPW